MVLFYKPGGEFFKITKQNKIWELIEVYPIPTSVGTYSLFFWPEEAHFSSMEGAVNHGSNAGSVQRVEFGVRRFRNQPDRIFSTGYLGFSKIHQKHRRRTHNKIKAFSSKSLTKCFRILHFCPVFNKMVNKNVGIKEEVFTHKHVWILTGFLSRSWSESDTSWPGGGAISQSSSYSISDKHTTVW